MPSKDYGSIRPKTTDGAKRKIDLLRRFNGKIINANYNNMDFKDNVFASGKGSDVISLSVYNNSASFNNGKYTQSATVLPNPKSRPLSAPFNFADGIPYNRSIRRHPQEEIEEIDNLKTRLAKDDITFSVKTIKRAFELPSEDEFQIQNKKYPEIENYLMKDPFPAKKKKKKKGKKKKKK